MPKPLARSSQDRDAALRLAEEQGVAEASRRTGIPAGTIYAWRSRAGLAGPPSGVDPASWAARKEAGALETYAAAQEALARVRELLKAGDERKAKDAAISLGILLDKSGLLESSAAVANERNIRLSEGVAQLLAEVIRALLQALKVPDTPALRRMVRELLTQASGGQVIVASPADSEAVRESVRARVAAELRQRIEAEVRAELCGLPAATDEGPSGEDTSGEDYCAVGEIGEAHHKDFAGGLTQSGPVEPVDAEVVDAEPVYEDDVPSEYLRGYGDPERARAAWEDTKRRLRDREEREEAPTYEFAVGRRESSDFSVDGPNGRRGVPSR